MVNGKVKKPKTDLMRDTRISGKRTNDSSRGRRGEESFPYEPDPPSQQGGQGARAEKPGESG